TSLSSLNQNAGSDASPEVSNLIAHATHVDAGQGGDLVGYLWNANFLTSHQASNMTTAPVSSGSQAAAAVVVTPTHFDATAASELQTFLKSNPAAKAVFDNHSIVVYDGATGAAAADEAVLHVWEFNDGS